MNNTLDHSGDQLIVTINPILAGEISFSGFTQNITGVTATRTLFSEFRVIVQGVFEIPWMALTQDNVSKTSFQTDTSFIIEVRLTRGGTDDTGKITYNWIHFLGKVADRVFKFPILDDSIFWDIYNRPGIDKIQDNLFKKLYLRGILPDFITRAQNLDRNEDVDFVSIFEAVSFFYSIILLWIKDYEEMYSKPSFIREILTQYGLYIDNRTTDAECKKLLYNFNREFGKRGTMAIFNEDGTSEARRLFNSKEYSEMNYSLIPVYKCNWYLGQHSPIYTGTEQSYYLNKTEENDVYVSSLGHYYTSYTDGASVTLDNIPGTQNKAIRLRASGALQWAGLGRYEGGTPGHYTYIDSRISYEITFRLYINTTAAHYLSYSIEAWINDTTKLTGAFKDRLDVITDTVYQGDLTSFRNGREIYFRCILFSYGTDVDSRQYTNMGVGSNLFMQNTNIRFILPRIMFRSVNNTMDVYLYDYKIRPLVFGTEILDSKSLSFLGMNNLFFSYIANENPDMSGTDINEYFERNLLPYDMVCNNIIL